MISPKRAVKLMGPRPVFPHNSRTCKTTGPGEGALGRSGNDSPNERPTIAAMIRGIVVAAVAKVP